VHLFIGVLFRSSVVTPIIEMMRICPKCGDYSVAGSAAFCSVDGTPFADVDPDSYNWDEGTRVLEEKANALRKLERKLKWRRVWSRLIITLITLTVVFAAIANGVIVLTPHTMVYKISGQVMDAGKPLAGSDIKLEGAESLQTKTDANGNYVFFDLLEGVNYTVVPVTNGELNFSPPTRSINNLMQDESADFSTVVESAFKISGRLMDEGKPVPGIRIVLAGAKSHSTTTDSNGYYEFAGLPAQNNYTIAPEPDAQINFTPESRSVSNLNRDESADFTRVVEGTFKISGHVMERRAPVADVKIVLAGAQTASTTTDSSGYYIFPNLRARSGYTITPATGAKVSFTPKTRSINNLTRDETADFSALVERAFKISGRVTEEKKPVANIKIMLSGARTASTTTDSNGYYAFANLPARSSYTITPAPSAKVSFTPKSRAITYLAQDETADFSAQVERAFQISGRVTEEREPVANITIVLTGAKTTSIRTDSNGYYVFTGLPARNNYTITPASSAKIIFSPKSRTINNLTQDESADFRAVVERAYKISGRVTEDNQPLGDVRIIMGGAKTDATTTDARGYYVFNNLPAGGSYTVTPNRSREFTPKSRSINGLARDESADFSAEVQRTYKISGRVIEGNEAIGDVRIRMGGTKTDATTTDARGYYVFNNLPAGGSYTVTPNRNGEFTPKSRSINGLARDESADFSAEIQRTYKISGRVTAENRPLGDVRIFMVGTRTDTTTTDSQGYYVFNNLPAGGAYTITTRSRMTFKPRSHLFIHLARDESANFNGAVEQLNFYKIDGRVMDGDKPLGEIKIQLDGARSASTITNANGYYTFNSLPGGGNYTITPATSARMSFKPRNRSFPNLTRDESADFLRLVQRNQDPIFIPNPKGLTPNATPTRPLPAGSQASPTRERPASQVSRELPSVKP
jgi:hypothetical protein